MTWIILWNTGKIRCQWSSFGRDIRIRKNYSLDALGFDLSAITQDMLGIEIQWCRDRLPDYFTLVHGIMTVNEVPEKIWLSIKADIK